MAEELSSIEFVFQVGLQRIQLQSEVFDALDQKAGMVLGFTVVSVGELLGFLMLAAAEGVRPSPYFVKLVQVPFLAGLVAVGLCTYFGLRSLWIREFALGFNFEAFVEDANPEKGLSADDLRKNSLYALLKSVNANDFALGKKRSYAKLATVAFLSSLACYGFTLGLIFLLLSTGA